MNQHPIPQNVTQYQFRLIGDMTIKQFIFLAAGIGLAIIAFNLPLLPALFKWPVAITCGFGGAAVAFLPINDRPMSEWIVNFFRSIYAPTHFTWQKTAIVPDYMNYKPQQALPTNLPPIEKKDGAKFSSFVDSLQQQDQNDLDHLETNKLQSLDTLFKQTTSGMPTPTPSPIPNMTDQKPAGSAPRMMKAAPTTQQINATVAKQQEQNMNQQKAQQAAPQSPVPAPLSSPPPPATMSPPTPVSSPTAPATSAPINPDSLRQTATQPAQGLGIDPAARQPESQTTSIRGNVLIENLPAASAIVEILDSNGQTLRTTKTDPQGFFTFPIPIPLGQYTVHCEHPQAQFTDTPLAATQVSTPMISITGRRVAQPSPSPSQINIPQSLQQTSPPTPMAQPPTPQQPTQPPIQQSSEDGPIISKASPLSPPIRVESANQPIPKPKESAQFLSDIQMPISPDTPNTLVGMTLTQQEQMIPNAIIEVFDKNNFPVRTVKSNNLGQFFISTPLNSGDYTIKAEHPDYQFQTFNLQVKGELIPPIKLVSQA